MPARLTYYALGAVVAAMGAAALVKHFVAPGRMPSIGIVPFWISLGAVLILAGLWFALKARLASLDGGKGRGGPAERRRPQAPSSARPAPKKFTEPKDDASSP